MLGTILIKNLDYKNNRKVSMKIFSSQEIFIVGGVRDKIPKASIVNRILSYFATVMYTNLENICIKQILLISLAYEETQEIIQNSTASQ